MTIRLDNEKTKEKKINQKYVSKLEAVVLVKEVTVKDQLAFVGSSKALGSSLNCLLSSYILPMQQLISSARHRHNQRTYQIESN